MFKDVAVTEVIMNDPKRFLDDSKILIGYTTHQAMKSNDFLPLEETEVAETGSRKTASFKSIQYFVDKFPTLRAKLEGKMDKLYDQFISHQVVQDSVVAQT